MKYVLIAALVTGITVHANQDEASLATYRQTFDSHSDHILKQYGGSLSNLLSQARMAGDLNGVLTLQKETERFKVANTVLPISQSDSIYRSAVLQYRQAMQSLLERYTSALEQLIRQEVAADRLNNAIAANQEKDKIATLLTEFRSGTPETTKNAPPLDSERQAEVVVQQNEQPAWGNISSPSGHGFIIQHESIKNATAGNPAVKWCMLISDRRDIVWKLELNNPAIVTQYALTSANDDPESDPHHWTFEGSNDGNSWTTLDTQRRSSGFSLRHHKLEFNVNNKRSFKNYRFVFKPRASVGKFQIGEIEIANLELTTFAVK